MPRTRAKIFEKARKEEPYNHLGQKLGSLEELARDKLEKVVVEKKVKKPDARR